MVAAAETPGINEWEDAEAPLGSALAGSSSTPEAREGLAADGSATGPSAAPERPQGPARFPDWEYEAAYNSADRQLRDLPGTSRIEVRSETEIRAAIDHDATLTLYNGAPRAYNH